MKNYEVKKKKNPLIAFLLQLFLFPFGGGYLYINKPEKAKRSFFIFLYLLLIMVWFTPFIWKFFLSGIFGFFLMLFVPFIIFLFGAVLLGSREESLFLIFLMGLGFFFINLGYEYKSIKFLTYLFLFTLSLLVVSLISAIDCFLEARKLYPPFKKEEKFIEQIKNKIRYFKKKGEIDRRCKDIIEKLKEKNLYKYLTLFIKKYYDFLTEDNLEQHFKTYDIYDSLIKLKNLLEFNDVRLPKKNFICLIAFVTYEQIFGRFKKKITASNPTSLDDVLNIFLELYPNYSEEEIGLLIRLLHEKEFEFEDEFEILNKLRHLEEMKKLEFFKKKLERADDNIITIKNIDSMNGYEFETFLKILFRKKNYVVKQTKLSHDQGADLIVEKHGERIVVQAKRFSNPVGNKAIQEVAAAVKHYNADRGMVITTSSFTKSAKSLARSNKIELVDRNKLKRWIDEYY